MIITSIYFYYEVFISKFFLFSSSFWMTMIEAWIHSIIIGRGRHDRIRFDPENLNSFLFSEIPVVPTMWLVDFFYSTMLHVSQVNVFEVLFEKRSC